MSNKCSFQGVYYIKEDVEKNRPLAQDSENRKKMKVSEEFPKNAFTLPKQLYKLYNDDTKTKQWKEAFFTIQPTYMYPDHEIKIIDQSIYDSMKNKENTVFIGKTDDFGAHLK